MRYDQLLDLIDQTRPRLIVEVGVARAERACAMCERALLHRPDVRYIGFDVFETRDAAFQLAAYNLKKVDSVKVCTDRLDAIRARHMGFNFTLVVGDTRETLQRTRIVADLAFIDGDHRVEAIRSDYEALKQSRVVVLDDYYVADERGMPDIDKVGCNLLLQDLNGAANLLPDSDPVRDGGRVQMAMVRAGAV